ncbi:MAG: ParB N-terminal domain-containing protein [Lachnospiraceae bacterium]|nr:ParB N-terminal domain-containing protein [Lachnospiraceae bacterium]
MSLDVEKFRAMRKDRKPLETFDDDFGDEEIGQIKKDLSKNTNDVKIINIDGLIPFSEYNSSYNQFDYSDERFEELMKSIEATGGIIEPLIIWEYKNDKTNKNEYIILSGKHRWLALKKLSEKDIKYKNVPVVLKNDITEDEAIFIFNTSNMTRRSFESMGSYQKAAALAQISDSFKKILNRKIKEDLGNKQNVYAGGEVNAQVGKQYGISSVQVSKYIKLYKTLKKKYFESIDNKKITIDNAYLLSSLDKTLLQDIFDMIGDGALKIDTNSAKEIKDENDKGIILDIKKVIAMCGKKKPKTSYSVKVKEIEEFDDFFSNKDEEEIENTIKEAIKEYIKNHK